MSPNIKASRQHPRYFERADGSAFIPVGPNLAFQRFVGDDEAFAAYGRQFATLAANGGNFARIWLGVPFLDIEPERDGVFDERRQDQLRRLCALAADHGVQLKLTLGHFRTLEPSRQAESFPGAASFVNTVHRPENGGACLTMEDYLSSEAGRAAFLRKLDKLAETLADADNIMAVELWNEINSVAAPQDAWRAWTEVMLPEMRRRFPRSLVVQSLGSFDSPCAFDNYQWLCDLPSNDFVQAHRYLDLGAELEICKGPMDELCADAVTWLLAHSSKPALLAEAGAVEPRHSGPSKLYPLDTEGTLLHDILFAPFFAGSAGPGQCWHWDFHLDKNKLWWHFQRFANAIAGVDPVAEEFQPLRLEHPQLRVYVLKGRGTSLLWCRDKASDWRSELVDGNPARRLEGIEINLGGLEGQAAAYLPWDDTHAPLQRDGDRLRLPPFKRSIVVKLQRS